MKKLLKKGSTAKDRIYPKTSIKQLAGNIKTIEPVDTEFSKYQIEDLIKWRNNASHRISGYDLTIKALSAEISSMVSRLNKTKKRRESDAKWVRRLHKILHKKVFKLRS
jgi:hypothetical protein